jgi:hypothetical protein
MPLSPAPIAPLGAGLFFALQLAATSLHAQVAIPVGTRVPVTSNVEFSSKTAKKGDPVSMVVSADVVIDGHVVIPKGLAVKGTVSDTKKAGRGGKAGKIEIALDSLQLPDGQKLGLYADLDDTTAAQGEERNGAGDKIAGAIPGASFLRKGDDVTFGVNQLIPVFTISYAAVPVPGGATQAAPTTAPPVATDSAHADSAGSTESENAIAPAAIGLFDATHTWARALAALAAHVSATPAIRAAGQQVISEDSALQVKGVALAAQSHTAVPTLDAETQAKLNGLLKALQATPADKFDATIMRQLYDVQNGFIGNIDPEDDSPMGKLLLEALPVWKAQLETVAKLIK